MGSTKRLADGAHLDGDARRPYCGHPAQDPVMDTWSTVLVLSALSGGVQSLGTIRQTCGSSGPLVSCTPANPPYRATN